MFGNYMGRRPDPFKNMMVFSLISWRRHSIEPVPGRRPVTVVKFRGKRSKEEERILSGKEEGGLSGVSGGRFLAVDFRKEIRFRKG